jgi:perosamine synthetase
MMNVMSPVGDFVERMARVLGATDTPLALHEPGFVGNERAYVNECIDTGWVSTAGKFVDEFESRLAELCGARHAVAVVNGTAGLHAALHVAGVCAGDEVLVPTLSFVATANAVSQCGAVPHFVDCSSDTYGMSSLALEEHLQQIAEPVGGVFRNKHTGRRLAAIVPMHVFGHPVDMEQLLALASRYRIPVVEDAAEALGARIGSRSAGTFGVAGVLSFNGNKIITTGGGGAVLTNDPEVARRLKHLTTTAKEAHRWDFVHDEVAFNYRMPNLNAALGCAQLERLPDILRKKKRLADAYAQAFSGSHDFRFVEELPGRISNNWLNAVELSPALNARRDEFLEAASDAGYQCRPVWRLLHRLAPYAACPRMDLAVAESVERRIINLPSSPQLFREVG